MPGGGARLTVPVRSWLITPRAPQAGGVPPPYFAFDGTDYEIDLNAKNAAAFGKQLASYTDHARKAGRALTQTIVLTELRVRILRCAMLEGQDGGILDDAIADFDGPPYGLIGAPCRRAAEHSLEVRQQGFADFPAGRVP